MIKSSRSQEICVYLFCYTQCLYRVIHERWNKEINARLIRLRGNEPGTPTATNTNASITTIPPALHLQHPRGEKSECQCGTMYFFSLGGGSNRVQDWRGHQAWSKRNSRSLGGDRLLPASWSRHHFSWLQDFQMRFSHATKRDQILSESSKITLQWSVFCCCCEASHFLSIEMLCIIKYASDLTRIMWH